ncbi:hypothetical protein ACIQU5_17285 [Streptomyces sp. NPDC090306]|uniref:hypothetical protein n=1 Tax=Streptomyces sp. NPDC090306 TaxID=3365961 RepID=UPI0038257837
MNDFDSSPTHDTDRSRNVAHTARDKTSEGAALVGERTSDVARTAKDQAASTAHEATTQARDMAGQLREQLQNQSRAQAKQLAANVRRLADELHDMSENGKPDSTTTTVVRQLADGGRQAAAHLENRGPEGIVEDLRGFARRKPGLFLVGAAVAGFAAARVGKAVSAAGSPSGAGSHPNAGPSPTGGGSDAVPATTGGARASEVPPSTPRPLPDPAPAPSYGERRAPGTVRRPEEY